MAEPIDQIKQSIDNAVEVYKKDITAKVQSVVDQLSGAATQVKDQAQVKVDQAQVAVDQAQAKVAQAKTFLTREVQKGESWLQTNKVAVIIFLVGAAVIAVLATGHLQVPHY